MLRLPTLDIAHFFLAKTFSDLDKQKIAPVEKTTKVLNKEKLMKNNVNDLDWARLRYFFKSIR